MAWHWQERFEIANVEGACRRQILKIQKPLPYEQWLKRKTRVNKDAVNQEADFHTADDTHEKQEESDAAFRDWLQRKREQATTANKQQKTTAPEHVRAKPWRKPPSMHVNPKTKSCTRKATLAESSMSTSSSANCFRQGHSSVENQQAYAAWLSRIRQEDQIRRAQRRQQLQRIEQQQRDKHKVTWRKKVAVCAYSTLVVDS